VIVGVGSSKYVEPGDKKEQELFLPPVCLHLTPIGVRQPPPHAYRLRTLLPVLFGSHEVVVGVNVTTEVTTP